MTSPQDKAGAEAVVRAIESGMSLRKACEATGVAKSTFLDWCAADAVLADQYARARDSMIDAMADDLLTIADADPGIAPTTGATDSGAVAHQKLRVEARKWLLSKLAPKRYGDRIEVAGDKDNPLEVRTVVRKIVDPTPTDNG